MQKKISQYFIINYLFISKHLDPCLTFVYHLDSRPPAHHAKPLSAALPLNNKISREPSCGRCSLISLVIVVVTQLNQTTRV